MFNTVLWATDGSDVAAQALPYALELTEASHARLVVAHARTMYTGRAGGYPVLADEDDIGRRIERQVADLRETGVDVQLVVQTCASDHAASTIAGIARDVEADVIVVGTHGYGRIAGLLLGSTTQGILHKGACPVLAIPTGGTPEKDARALEEATAK